MLTLSQNDWSISLCRVKSQITFRLINQPINVGLITHKRVYRNKLHSVKDFVLENLFSDRFRPVSYTHLDVYKRQVKGKG